MDVDDPLSALEVSMSQLAEALLDDPAAPADTLERVVALGVELIADCRAAGVLLLQGHSAVTTASTDPIVLALHDLQRDLREGPCLDALTHQRAYYATDLETDEQWPAFATGAAELGLRSVLAYPILDAGGSSALNLYSEMPAAFGAIDRAQGLLLTVFAALAIGAASERERAGVREHNLRAALRTREVIGQAQGILMERERISGDQAFALLRRSSQHLNVKLREVAENLIVTGETPQTGAS